MAPACPQPWKLVVLAPLGPELLAGLFADLPVQVSVPGTPDLAGVADVLRYAELVLGDWRTANPGVTAETLRIASRLAFVQQPSVGVQAHDTQALAAAEVPLANVAGFNAVSVAEWVLGAALALAHQLTWAEAELRAQRWPQLEVIERGAVEVAGRRVGLVGFGPVGVACADRFRALGCSVSYWSRRRRAPGQERGAIYRGLDDLVATSDVLVVAIALGAQTRGLLDAPLVAQLPAGALVVVASRGGIVDETAMADAVEAGRLAGAAFDVYASEPLPAESRLRRGDRILLTPHTAGSTREASGRLIQAVRANLARAVSGEPVVDVVNGVDPIVHRRR